MTGLTGAQRVALIGALDVCRRVVVAAKACGFAGTFDFINPHHELAGTNRYRTVGQLPLTPDLAYVAVPAEHCLSVVQALADQGCPLAVVYSSGFAELGTEAGRARQRALVEAAGAMTLIGPNCYGLLDYVSGLALWPDQHGGRRLEAGERGVAIVAQSSSIAISMSMTDRVPLAHLHTVGNGACRSAFAIAESLIEQPEVTAVGLLVESVSDLDGLTRLASRSRALSIPVVALVLGRSEEAARVVLSHSASLRTESAVTSALLAKLGVGEVADVEELIAGLALLHCHGPLANARLTSLSCSGGEASLLADAASGSTVTFPPLTTRQRAELEAVLGERVTLDNPLDYHTYIWGDEPAMTAAFEAMLADPGDLNLFFADLPGVPCCDSSDWHASLRAFAKACRARQVRGAFTAAMSSNLSAAQVKSIAGQGFPILSPPKVAIAAVTAAVSIGRAWAGPATTIAGRRAVSTASRALTEDQGKAWLAGLGMAVPQACSADDPTAVEDWARSLGRPVVVKAIGLAHKSEHQAVRLNLEPEQARGAAEELLGLTGQVLVEEQITEVLVELLVSVEHDPVVGPVLALGRGGVLVELEADLVHLVLPCSSEGIRRALNELRCAPLLYGYRGRPEADLVSVIDAIARLAQASDQVISAEINPLLVTETRAVVGDALVTIGVEDGVDDD